MQKKGKMAVKRLAVNAVLIAIYYTLRLLNIPFGDAFRFTLAPFSVILCALLYGPVDGLIVGLLGEFMSQILGPYGLTPTTLLWVLPEAVRGGLLGLWMLAFRKNGLPAPQLLKSWKQVIYLAGSSIIGIIASAVNTFALYVDSKMFGYYNEYMVFGVLVVRLSIAAVMACLFGYVALQIVSILRKSNLGV